HQRLVAAADRADAADHDRGAGARDTRRRVDLETRHATLERGDEVLPLRLRDVGARNRLLRRADRALLCGLAERGDDDGLEADRVRAQLELDVRRPAVRPGEMRPAHWSARTAGCLPR